MAERLTWDTIRSMDSAALDCAIEEHCYSARWNKRETDWLYIHQITFNLNLHNMTYTKTPEIILPDNHSMSWGRALALAYRYGISLRHMQRPDTTYYWRITCKGKRSISAHDNKEALLAVCRLALYRAVQTQEQRHV